ncbi:MAG TPA: M20/M25/M40 family metallo-hydrolase [Clostridia bacterium]|nr:M20/M25/M40 family metallo-hydrolase [Clostridia bacterium]
MINRERMVNEFKSLVGIDSLSKKERQMADILTQKMKALGCEVYEDNAGQEIGGNTGNLICNLKGNSDVPALMITAHMDTVAPGEGKKPIEENGIIHSDHTTVLGGDDAAGIECILEVMRVLNEDKIEHGGIQAVFTVAEEGGLFGAKHLDYSRIHAKYGIVLDSDGPIGTVAVKAPSQYRMYVTIRGLAAHAGIAPEKGISAIQIASAAISSMKLGRIDFETTANIGVISGGRETNIVCDSVEIKAEARSRDKEKLERQKEHMKECFEKAASDFGGSVDFRAVLEYPSYNISKDAKILGILKKAAGSIGIEMLPEETGGGSDTNIFNGKGIEAVDVSVGMDKVHSVDEQIRIDDMVKAAEFVLAAIRSM